MRAIPVRRNGFARVLTLRNVRRRSAFSLLEGSEWGRERGNGGRERGAMKNAKTPQLASPESSTILLFSPRGPPHFSQRSFHFFTASPEILEYRRSIFLQRVYQNDYENDERYCQANNDEHQFLRTEYRELPSLVDVYASKPRRRTRETERERVVERKRFVYVLLQPREKKRRKNHVNLAIEPYTKLYVYPCILLLNWKNEKKIANSPFSFSLFSLSLSISICLSISIVREKMYGRVSETEKERKEKKKKSIYTFLTRVSGTKCYI